MRDQNNKGKLLSKPLTQKKRYIQGGETKIMRKITAYLLIFALVFTLVAPVGVASANTPGERLQALGLIQGGTGGDLMVNAEWTRQDLAVVLSRLLGEEGVAQATATSHTFQDVTNPFYNSYISWAVQNGYFEGYNATTFGFGDVVTNQQFVAVMLRALGYDTRGAAYANVPTLAVEKGLVVAGTNFAASSTRGALYGVIENTLKAELADGSATLGAALELDGYVEAPVVITVTEAVAVDANTISVVFSDEVVVTYELAEALVANVATEVEVEYLEETYVVTVTWVVEALEVVSVSAVNLKQVEVVFSADVDKTTAQTIGNYKVYNSGATTNLAAGGSAVLQADGKSVLVTLGTALNNGQNAKVEVEKVKSAVVADEIIEKYSNSNVVVMDSVVPTVVGVEVVGPKQIRVEFSEPVTGAANGSDFEVDAGNYIITGAAFDAAKSEAVITVGVDLTVGEHTLKIVSASTIADYAGYKVVQRTMDFTYAADDTVPTVSVKSATPTEVRLVFSKPVVNVDNANVRYRHTFNTDNFKYVGDDNINAVPDAFITAISTTEYKLDFSEMPIPLGNNKLYIGYVSNTGTMIQDNWGNKFAAEALDLVIELDLVKPTVKEVKFVDAATLKVTFSKTVANATAGNAANYKVMDSAGDNVAVLSATLGGTNNDEVTLDFGANALGGGSYTVSIEKVKDTALVANTMEAYSTTLSVKDTVNPTVLASKYVFDNTVGAQKANVYIPFSEAMKADTLVKANILKNVNTGGFVALGTNDSIAIAADGKSVTLTIANAGTDFTSLDIKLGAVTDLAGNGLVGFVADSTGGADFALTADAIAVKEVEAIARKQIKVTFTGKLSSVTATGFSFAEVVAGNDVYVNALSVASHTVNKDNESEVVFNLANNLSYDVTSNGNEIQLVVAAATGTKSFLGSVVDNLAANAAGTAGDVADKIAPVLNTAVVDSATQITLTFHEELKASTFAATLNGFSVAGGNAKLTSVVITGGVDATTVVLTGTGFVAETTTVSYNSVAGITDVAGNKLANITDKATQ